MRTLANMWADSPTARLTAVRCMTDSELSTFRQTLVTHSPRRSWPYGCPTVINPLVVTLAVSPGNSPKLSEEAKSTAELAVDLPTAGKPNQGIFYKDRAGFWEKMRVLAKSSFDGYSENDAYSLFGHLNLDTERSAAAKNVTVDLQHSKWVLDAICQYLRPRFLILLGLKDYLSKNKPLRKIFETVVSVSIRNEATDYDFRSPHRIIPFEGSSKRNLVYLEWDVVLPNGHSMCVVMWPQHPSRAPFSNMALLSISCAQFASRHNVSAYDELRY